MNVKQKAEEGKILTREEAELLDRIEKLHRMDHVIAGLLIMTFALISLIAWRMLR